MGEMAARGADEAKRDGALKAWTENDSASITVNSVSDSAPENSWTRPNLIIGDDDTLFFDEEGIPSL